MTFTANIHVNVQERGADVSWDFFDRPMTATTWKAAIDEAVAVAEQEAGHEEISTDSWEIRVTVTADTGQSRDLTLSRFCGLPAEVEFEFDDDELEAAQ